MRKTIGIITVMIMIVVSNLHAGNAEKGAKVYKKKFRKHCEMSGDKFASLHTQRQWKKIFKNKNKLVEVIEDVCSEEAAKEISNLKKRKVKFLNDFVVKYAKDSGITPSCN